MFELAALDRQIDLCKRNLSDSQLEVLPLAFAAFLDTAMTATGRATFYNDRKQQEAAVETVHDDLFQIDRDIYAACLMLPGVTDYSRQLGILRLLKVPRRGGLCSAGFEAAALTGLTNGLPAQRMLKLFGLLRRQRVNNARTRRLILSAILNSQRLEFWSVKYRSKLRCALVHAWGRRTASILRSILSKSPEARTDKEDRLVRDLLVRHLLTGNLDLVQQCVRFILGDEQNLTAKRLAAYHAAKSDFVRGSLLPIETMEGLRSRFHPSRTHAEVLQLTKSQLTVGQKITVQRKAQEAGVQVDFDPQNYDAIRLYLYAYEIGMTERIQQALRAKAQETAAGLPVSFQRMGILLDSSQSMLGHDSQARRPMASVLAIRDVLAAKAQQTTTVSSSGRVLEDFELVQAEGDTSLAAGLVQLLKENPDVVFVLSDGYENAPAGRFHQTVLAARRMGIRTPIHQINPVFAAEAKGVRCLSDQVTAMPVAKPEAMGLGLLKALMESDIERAIAVLFRMTGSLEVRAVT